MVRVKPGACGFRVLWGKFQCASAGEMPLKVPNPGLQARACGCFCTSGG